MSSAMSSLLLLLLLILGRIVASANVVTSASAADVEERSCYEPERDFYPYLSTRTAYQLVHGNITRPESTCKPVQIWMLARHGTRYPGKKIVPLLLHLPNIRDQIIRNHELGAGQLCKNDLENLRDWQLDPNLNDEMADSLSAQGKEDLRLLAKRMQSSFPELLQVDPEDIKPGDYVFRATDSQRTQASLKSFARGLFGSSKHVTVEAPPVNDTLLLAHKNCPAWDVGYRVDRVDAERNKFTVRPEVQGLMQALAERLGFPRNKIDNDLVKTMYEMCRFETAWYLNRTSTWCSVFRKEELKILEYREDLDYYYCCGPGREMSGRLGCQTLSDMYHRFEKLESGNLTNQPKGVFYFAHTVTLQSLMAALKIGRDSPPILSTNYASAGNRKYRTSLTGPFATNVVAVFYRCDGEKSSNKVMLYIAEKMVPLAGCRDGLCNWEYLKRDFGPDVGRCTMDFCNKLPLINETNSSGSSNTGTGDHPASAGDFTRAGLVLTFATFAISLLGLRGEPSF